MSDILKGPHWILDISFKIGVSHKWIEDCDIQVIAQQLEPYIRSITAMMERVQPEVLISLKMSKIQNQSQVTLGHLKRQLRPKKSVAVAGGRGG